MLGSDYPFADLVTGTLLAEDIDLFGLYDVKGSLVWGALPEARLGGLPIDPEKLEEYLATPLNLPLAEEQTEGFVANVAGLASFVAREAVVHEDLGAAVVGYVAMVRFIDGREITQWEAVSGTRLNVNRPAAGGPETGNPETSGVTFDLVAFTGEDLLQLELVGTSEGFEVARDQFKTAMNYSLIVGAATFFLLVFASRGFVVEPVARLARQVVRLSTAGQFGTKKRLTVSGRSEAAMLLPCGKWILNPSRLPIPPLWRRRNSMASEHRSGKRPRLLVDCNV